MRRLPLLPTLLVALAVAAMLALGVWQLQRRAEKREALARYAANLMLPGIRYYGERDDPALLFRHARTACIAVTGWQHQGGRGVSGSKGWRQIAMCRTPENHHLLVDMGVSPDPMAQPRWQGGVVTGTLTYAPDHRPLIVAAFERAPRALMLVSSQAAPGLEPSAPPDLNAVPNNHLAYAVQWFLFAGVAVVIYALALRRRGVGLRQSEG